MKLGDDYQYPLKGSGESSYKIDSVKSLMKDVLYVPGLKNNILSISALDAKGIRVSFIDGQVLISPRGKTIEDATVIGEEDGGLCDSLNKHWFMSRLNQMNCGTKGLHMCTTKHY